MSQSQSPDISQVFLFDSKTEGSVEAELWDSITEKNLADWEAYWIPELQKRLKILHGHGVSRSLWPQSRLWDWRKKLLSIEGLLANQCFSIVCNDMTQAMMIADLTHRSQIDASSTAHLVYIEYLEAAPWNRKDITGEPALLKGCGSLMLRAAIEYSLIEGFDGRIGLHSLPQANDFYANQIGMTDLGIDANYQNLRYFEFTPEQAKAYIKEGE
tara:strand:- start:1204 stop:1845 length:642 start_codon:yes stop_codon:yes gene_type:complete